MDETSAYDDYEAPEIYPSCGPEPTEEDLSDLFNCEPDNPFLSDDPLIRLMELRRDEVITAFTENARILQERGEVFDPERGAAWEQIERLVITAFDAGIDIGRQIGPSVEDYEFDLLGAGG